MEQPPISDVNPTMLANATFDKILEQIQTSNLNFQLTLSPFSAAISLKKSFIKDKYGNILLPSPSTKVISQQEFNLQHDNAELVEKNEKLDQQNLQLQRTNQSQLQNIKILEKKIVDIEASAYNSFREKSNELTVLKNTLQSSDQEMTKLKNELQIKNKLIKVKEKEVLKLDQNRDILEATAKKCKEELKTLKSDYKKLQKKEKITSEKSSPENDAENKLSKIKTPTLTDSSSSHFEKTDPLNNLVTTRTLSASSSTTTSSPSIPVSSPATSSTTAPIGSKSPSSPQAEPDSCPRISPVPATNRNSCQHKPQCTIRQPQPPPPSKCAILVHQGSQYHEHFPNAPARYGPHDDCMAVMNRNYGCTDCVWFKKWGDLHGYPDMWPYKYVSSGDLSSPSN